MNIRLKWKDAVMPDGKTLSRIFVYASIDAGKTFDIVAVVTPGTQQLLLQEVARGTWRYDLECLDTASMPYPRASVTIAV